MSHTHLTMRALARLAGMMWASRLPTLHAACSLEGGAWHDVVLAGEVDKRRPTCPACAVLADQALDLAAERMAARIERRRISAERRNRET